MPSSSERLAEPIVRHSGKHRVLEHWRSTVEFGRFDIVKLATELSLPTSY